MNACLASNPKLAVREARSGHSLSPTCLARSLNSDPRLYNELRIVGAALRNWRQTIRVSGHEEEGGGLTVGLASLRARLLDVDRLCASTTGQEP